MTRAAWIFPIFVLLACGCTTYVTPPPPTSDSTTVYLTDYGKHASIVLPEPNGGYLEYAFGDWEYFAMGHTGAFTTLRAIAGSPQSTLGRRHLNLSTDQAEMARALGTTRIMNFQVSRTRVTKLLSDLDARFRAEVQPVYHSTYSDLDHVRDREFYWGGNNCNHVTAGWLKELGCKIDGPAMFSNFILRP